VESTELLLKKNSQMQQKRCNKKFIKLLGSAMHAIKNVTISTTINTATQNDIYEKRNKQISILKIKNGTYPIS
jgi:3-deoxy-D-manno-octulosonate 8-phosphate phosphatase KdsC-like HAD superfamily phosphatase